MQFAMGNFGCRRMNPNVLVILCLSFSTTIGPNSTMYTNIYICCADWDDIHVPLRMNPLYLAHSTGCPLAPPTCHTAKFNLSCYIPVLSMIVWSNHSVIWIVNRIVFNLASPHPLCFLKAILVVPAPLCSFLNSVLSFALFSVRLPLFRSRLSLINLTHLHTCNAVWFCERS